MRANNYPDPSDNSPEAIATRVDALRASGTLDRIKQRSKRRAPKRRDYRVNGINGLESVSDR